MHLVFYRCLLLSIMLTLYSKSLHSGTCIIIIMNSGSYGCLMRGCWSLSGDRVWMRSPIRQVCSYSFSVFSAIISCHDSGSYSCLMRGCLSLSGDRVWMRSPIRQIQVIRFRLALAAAFASSLGLAMFPYHPGDTLSPLLTKVNPSWHDAGDALDIYAIHMNTCIAVYHVYCACNTCVNKIYAHSQHYQLIKINATTSYMFHVSTKVIAWCAPLVMRKESTHRESGII